MAVKSRVFHREEGEGGTVELLGSTSIISLCPVHSLRSRGLIPTEQGSGTNWLLWAAGLEWGSQPASPVQRARGSDVQAVPAACCPVDVFPVRLFFAFPRVAQMWSPGWASRVHQHVAEVSQETKEQGRLPGSRAALQGSCTGSLAVPTEDQPGVGERRRGLLPQPLRGARLSRVWQQEPGGCLFSEGVGKPHVMGLELSFKLLRKKTS